MDTIKILAFNLLTVNKFDSYRNLKIKGFNMSDCSLLDVGYPLLYSKDFTYKYLI